MKVLKCLNCKKFLAGGKAVAGHKKTCGNSFIFIANKVN